MQAALDVHETPCSWAAAAPAGNDVGSTVQPLPSQRAATGPALTPAPLKPTAVQVLFDVHDTPVRAAADRFGVG
jgi:hypothetical protein